MALTDDQPIVDNQSFNVGNFSGSAIDSDADSGSVTLTETPFDRLSGRFASTVKFVSEGLG